MTVEGVSVGNVAIPHHSDFDCIQSELIGKFFGGRLNLFFALQSH